MCRSASFMEESQRHGWTSALWSLLWHIQAKTAAAIIEGELLPVKCRHFYKIPTVPSMWNVKLVCNAFTSATCTIGLLTNPSAEILELPQLHFFVSQVLRSFPHSSTSHYALSYSRWLYAHSSPNNGETPSRHGMKIKKHLFQRDYNAK